MFEKIVNVINTLHGFNLYPEVALFCLCAYFIVRQWLKIINIRYSIYIPIIAAFIGEYAFTPKIEDFQDVVMFIVLSTIQAGFAVGLYSMADKYGVVDKIGGWVGNKFKKQEGENI